MTNEKYANYFVQPKTTISTFRAALYIRLSKEDGDKSESNSVTSQREILKEYLKLHPDIEIYDFYIDDGWSGTNFDRPNFNRMMEDIYSGKVNCVIVKDLSRFGRNYSDAGYYLDSVFLRFKIRFIALNNGIDTASNNMNAATQCISVGVTNVINESIAATTSVNVRGTLNVNRAQGKFIGSFPTYGYLKDPKDHHKLIIDEETAPIVQMIFKKFISGESIIGIAKDLNEMGIPNPSTYKKIKGFNYKHTSGKRNDGLWPDSTVRRILTNEMYIGNMVQGKNTTISYKIKQCRAIPKEDWIIIKNTHEPIIDKETFEMAQSLFNKNIRKPPNEKNVNLFAGLVKCADCHRAMNKKTNVHSYGTYSYYRCSTSRKMKKSLCSNHTIRIDKMEQAVLVYLQTMINLATEYDDIITKINENKSKKQESNNLKKTLQTQKNEKEKYVQMITELYTDFKDGIINKEEYVMLKTELNKKISFIDSAIENINRSMLEYEKGVDGDNDFISNFKKYKNITTLTRQILVELVEEILVHEGGNITIKMKFNDAFEMATEYIEANLA